jgi:hypothetical protein
LGNQTIQLKRTTPRQMATADRISGLVIQALRYLGSSQINDTVLAQLRQRLTEDDKQQLRRDLNYVPTWMRPDILKITQPQAA